MTVYTNRGSINPAAVAKNARGVLMIGDSLLSTGAEPMVRQFGLDNRPLHYNAEPWRPSDGGITVLIEAMHRAWVPPTICWLLGASDVGEYPGETFCSLAYALKRAPGKQWWIATTYRTKPSEAENRINAEVWRLAQRHSNIHVFDWKYAASRHPEWLSDGFHPNTVGAKWRANLLLAAMRKVQP